MNLIVAVDENWAIGSNNGLLYHLPPDLKHFKNITNGKIVVMGEKTLFSLPNSQPLPNRENIVLSNNENFKVENAVVFNTLPTLLQYLNTLPTEDIFVIGGAMVYELLLPYCSTAYITHIFSQKQADRFFPNLSKMQNWKVIEKSEKFTYNDLKYAFYIYKNSSPLPLI